MRSASGCADSLVEFSRKIHICYSSRDALLHSSCRANNEWTVLYFTTGIDEFWNCDLQSQL